MKVNIRLIGCDDTTEFIREMTEHEFAFLGEIAEKSNKVSTYRCMPVMELEIVEGEE